MCPELPLSRASRHLHLAGRSVTDLNATGALPFAERHIGPDPEGVTTMLESLGLDSLEALMDAAVPKGIRSHDPLRLPAAVDEETAAAELRHLASLNNPLEP